MRCKHSPFIDGVVDPGVVVNGAALVVVTTGAAGVVVSGAVVVTTAHSSSSLPSRQSTFSSQTHVSGMHSSPQENSPGHFLSVKSIQSMPVIITAKIIKEMFL